MMAATVMTAATAANAADVPLYQPPPQPICVPRAQAHLWPGVPLCAEEAVFGGWYLRGDIGFSNQTVHRVENNLVTLPEVDHVSAGFSTAGIFGLGVGYNVNNWLRLDVTGEYRGNSDFTGLDVTSLSGGNFTDEYRAKKSEWLFLANAYLDLGTWWCVTPFVGAGIGTSRVTISGFQDINTPNAGVAFGPTESKWNFAWALHAGLAYQVNQNLALEFSYRYAHLGDGIVGDVRTYTGRNQFKDDVTTFKNINSHDLRLGVRWVCCDAPPPPPPIISKG